MRLPAACPSRRDLIGLVVFCASLAPVSGFAEAPSPYQWQPAGVESGCELAKSEVRTKRYIAAKATCVVAASVHEVGDVLRDIPHYSEWMHDCAATTMLEVVDREKDTYVFWFRQHVPILTDRDIVLKSEVRREEVDGRTVVSIVARSTDAVKHDSGKGLVRMPSFTSEWRLEAVDAQHTRVTFMIDPDLGPGLPVGFANHTILKVPFKSIRGLMRVLGERRERLSATP